MSHPRLQKAPGIVHRIIDLLQDEPVTLKKCCLVSKSFVALTRKHLFGHIKFENPVELEAWKKVFPDPLTSPAHYATSLFVNCTEVVTARDAKKGGWITPFTNVTRLEVWNGILDGPELKGSLAPFQILPSVKSLRLCFNNFPPSEVFNFICSFPLLEDLEIVNDRDINCIGRLKVTAPPLRLPPLTGTLALQQPLLGQVKDLLLQLPGGLHFRKIEWNVHLPKELEGMMALVKKCSNTLECIDIARPLFEYPSTASIDLSSATKLEEVVFQVNAFYVPWITAALKTIKANLRRISISVLFPSKQPVNVKEDVGRETYRQWMDLDKVLVRLCNSRLGCRVKVIYEGTQGGMDPLPLCPYIKGLLPKMTKGELIDAVPGHGQTA